MALDETQPRTHDPRPGGVAPAVLDESLRRVFENRNGGVTLSGSSRARCWDAAIEGMLQPGDRVLVAGAGPEADIWAQRARRIGIDVIRGSTAWGEPPSADELCYLLWWDPSIRAVFVVHTDIGNGATVDVAELRQAMDAAGSAALLLVDASESVGISAFHQSGWRVDVAVAGSDRGLMGIAGVSAFSFSPRAMAVGAVARARRKLPPVSAPSLTALGARLKSIHDEGLPQVLARHARIAGAVRAAVGAWGLGVCAEAGNESSASTAIVLPAGVDATSLADVCERSHALHLEAWASHPCGSVVVMRHHGAYFEKTCFGDVGALELSLGSLGLPVVLGTGLEAACQYLRVGGGRAAA
jgi:alanine-glyoxylate transaminase/serine-glyoxylate transaminase/serine-pyruvate transaminase